MLGPRRVGSPRPVGCGGFGTGLTALLNQRLAETHPIAPGFCNHRAEPASYGGLEHLGGEILQNITGRARRALAASFALIAGLSLAFAGTTGAQAEEKSRAQNTVLTVKIRSCEGCEVTLISYLKGSEDDGWASDPHSIRNGKAAFVVPTEKTLGLNVAVKTPWEGHLATPRCR